MMTECTPQEWIRGTRLGSTLDLCDRYRIDRSVLRQAIRILESAGIAVTLTGRGHGLITQAPQFSSVCRLISCHFAAHDLSASAAVELFHWFSVEAVAEAAKLAASVDIERINRVLDKTNEAELLTALAEIEDGLFSTLKNPLIELFLRSTMAFPSWDTPACDDPTLMNKIYLVETRNVVDAIARRDSARAAAAQDRKHRRLLVVASWSNRSSSGHLN